MRVLLLDDEPSAARAPRRAVRAPAAPSCVGRLQPAAPRMRSPAPIGADVVVVGPAAAARADLGDVIAALADRVPVVVVGERDQAAAAVAAMKAGAADYVVA